jgi:hypothetical protein
LKKDDPEKLRKIDRRNNLARYRGMTETIWEEMFNKQGRVCAICKATEPRGVGWHTDHCHTTGKVRGILCHDCNMGLGYYERTVLPNLEAFKKFLES